MLRWMAPFLSFTAEEAWKVFGNSDSIFLEELRRDRRRPTRRCWPSGRASARSATLANKEIEALRAEGQVGSSLQANLALTAPADDHALLASLGDDLKFVFITSAVDAGGGRRAGGRRSRPAPTPSASAAGTGAPTSASDAAHPTICGRCASNLFGAGEAREHA